MPDIKIASLDNSEFSAYSAEPPTGRGPGLIVIQEIYGINAAMRKLCDDFAAQGYIAFCPDLFWRQEPNVQLTDKKPQDLARAAELFRSFDVEVAVRDLISVLGHIRKMRGCNGKVGAVGYGLGGRLAYLMATRSDVDASVSYTPTDLDKNLDEIHDVSMPLLLHFAANDKLMPPEKRIKILHSLTRNPRVMARLYENVGEAFAIEGGKNYSRGTAEVAGNRTKEFLAQNLII